MKVDDINKKINELRKEIPKASKKRSYEIVDELHKLVRNCYMESKIIHMSCLGVLCEPLGYHIKTQGMRKEEYNSQLTLRPNDVTCPKCIEILKKQKILR